MHAEERHNHSQCADAPGVLLVAWCGPQPPLPKRRAAARSQPAFPPTPVRICFRLSCQASSGPHTCRCHAVAQHGARSAWLQSVRPHLCTAEKDCSRALVSCSHCSNLSSPPLHLCCSFALLQPLFLQYLHPWHRFSKKVVSTQRGNKQKLRQSVELLLACDGLGSAPSSPHNTKHMATLLDQVELGVSEQIYSAIASASAC